MTETAVKGTYVVVFKAKTAGTASILTAIVKGITLSMQPSILVM